MNDISGPAEVRDHRYSARRESFKHHARTEVSNGWKHQHIRRSIVNGKRVARLHTNKMRLPVFRLQSAPRRTIARHAPHVRVARTTHKPIELRSSVQATAPLATLRTQPVAAFCGIGNPQAFRQTLADLGAEITDFRTFPDHHAYTRTDVEALWGWAERQANAGIIVTTQKDLVKLRLAQLGGRALWALRICLHVEAEQEALERTLLSVVRSP